MVASVSLVVVERRAFARSSSPVGKLVRAWTALRAANAGSALGEASYLVDPASSHMLVSKIKPCMSKFKRL